MAELTTGKVIALIRALSTSSTSSATYTVTDALILGAATTSGVRLDLESGALAVREGDDSAYAPLKTGLVTASGLGESVSSRFFLTGTRLGIGSAGDVAWASGATAPGGGGTADTGLARDAAAQVVVTDGSTGVGNLRATALIVGTADTSGVRLDLESGTLAVREGDDSGYGDLRANGLVLKDGTSSAPAIAGTTAANTGIYFDSTAVYFTSAGSVVAAIGGATAFAGKVIQNYKVNVGAFTTDQTFATTGQWVTNEGASGALNHTLPAAVAGTFFCAFVHTNQYLRFTAATGDTIRDGATVSATAGYIRSTTVGSTIMLMAVNITEWVVMYKTGTWTVDS